MMLTDAELGPKKLEDYELRCLELELRTGGSINMRDVLRAIIELQELREFEGETVSELRAEIEDLEATLREKGDNL